MSAAILSHPLISSLITHGSTLAVLLRTESRENNLHEKVRDVVNQLLEEFDRAQGSAAASFPEESMANVMEKIEGTLQRFNKIDSGNASYYEELGKRVRSFRSRMLQSSATAAAVSLPAPDDSSLQYQANSNPTTYTFLQEEFDFEVTYGNLTDKEKQCLGFFSLFPNGRKINKRELIRWWVGMGLINSNFDGEGENVLHKLVVEGFIEQAIINKKLSNKYTMNNASISSKIDQSMMDNFGSLKAVEDGVHLDDKSVPAPEKIEALININQNTVNSKGFESLSKMKNVKVIHLGNWQRDNPTNNYIVVEDTEFLKVLKNLGHLRFLSLEGISGIVELPDFVYKLENLRVLDLRACHNLESLPEGIHSLKQLTHLDLSECYLLDNIPKGITSLRELRVLKGFIVDPVGNRILESASNSCAFSSLSKLQQLRKLTVRTRRMDFPTPKDLQTLCEMQQLNNLGIEWVGSSTDYLRETGKHTGFRRFPSTLEKLVLQAAPESALSQLLELISNRCENFLEILYIRGGELRELNPKMHCFLNVKEVHLRYLPKLHTHWFDFKQSFPNLSRLQIFGCPNLIFFPCDENGVWQQYDQSSHVIGNTDSLRASPMVDFRDLVANSWKYQAGSSSK